MIKTFKTIVQTDFGQIGYLRSQASYALEQNLMFRFKTCDNRSVDEKETIIYPSENITLYSGQSEDTGNDNGHSSHFPCNVILIKLTKVTRLPFAGDNERLPSEIHESFETRKTSSIFCKNIFLK